MNFPFEIQTENPRKTQLVAMEFAQCILPDALILLEGDLGSGKTVFVKGLAQAVGIDPAEVRSPTFVLAQELEGSGGRLVHLDLYRIQMEDVEKSGLLEHLWGPGLIAVEWAERLPVVPTWAWRVLLHWLGPSRRKIRILAPEQKGKLL